MSKVGEVSPCCKKVGTSDYREGTFCRIHGRLGINFNTIFIAGFLHVKAYSSIYDFHHHSSTLAILELNKGKHSEHL